MAQASNETERELLTFLASHGFDGDIPEKILEVAASLDELYRATPEILDAALKDALKFMTLHKLKSVLDETRPRPEPVATPAKEAAPPAPPAPVREPLEEPKQEEAPAPAEEEEPAEAAPAVIDLCEDDSDGDVTAPAPLRAGTERREWRAPKPKYEKGQRVLARYSRHVWNPTTDSVWWPGTVRRVMPGTSRSRPETSYLIKYDDEDEETLKEADVKATQIPPATPPAPPRKKRAPPTER
eukprot:CAMPEP_0119296904 /NCGR_PEP_ID=MMETSP1329-20130426/50810_1 /TAXON_ID=114041 /ORGANISM="Genus nov. species nov., Strain RCC1024" /LENGTH=240 /DNA_ID=CAMNT_0007297845 /DNA_START=83 /DNA_END=802 /DNA_ORIENTATION=+